MAILVPTVAIATVARVIRRPRGAAGNELPGRQFRPTNSQTIAAFIQIISDREFW